MVWCVGEDLKDSAGGNERREVRGERGRGKTGLGGEGMAGI